MNKFAKNIFHVWFQGCENVTDLKFKENIKNWEKLNPDWNYFCMKNDDLENACKIFSQECLNAYNKFNTMHLKIDLGKLVLLYLNGGIIIDMDMYALRSLSYSNIVNNIIEEYNTSNSPILGVSKSEGNFIERKIQAYGNAVMISSPMNPLLKELILEIIKNINVVDKNSSDYWIINKTSGPFLFSKFINKNLYNTDKSKIVEIDYNVFEPCILDGTCHVNENTISLHKYELSWVPKGFQNVIFIYFKYIRKNILIFIIMLILIYFLYKKWH